MIIKLKPQQVVSIHSYKHNGNLHRVWKHSTVIEESNDLLIVYNNRTKVIESTGRKWYSKEPAVVYFFKKHWFNVIAMLRKEGIVYYCNLSSPYLYDGEAIKYIDYDLDVKVFPSFSYKTLDRNEYLYHAELMNYPEELKKIVEAELKVLLSMIKRRKSPFIHEEIMKHYSSVNNTSKKQEDK